jgi:hypothetical protein
MDDLKVRRRRDNGDGGLTICDLSRKGGRHLPVRL